jgi:hypothetical protein
MLLPRVLLPPLPPLPLLLPTLPLLPPRPLLPTLLLPNGTSARIRIPRAMGQFTRKLADNTGCPRGTGHTGARRALRFISGFEASHDGLEAFAAESEACFRPFQDFDRSARSPVRR